MDARRESPGHAASPRARAAIFLAAAAIGAFDLGSYAFFKRESVDFVVARRQGEAPACRIGVPISWQGQAPGALSGWFRPEATGAWSSGPAAALAARLPGRPGGDLLLVARVSAYVGPGRLKSRQVEVFVNHAPVAVWQFDHGEPMERTARVARTLVVGDGIVRVDFRFPDAGYAMDAGGGDRAPRAGMKLIDWRLEPAPP